MTVSELLKMDIDIDIYDDVCEELAIAFCGAVELTPEGSKEFSEVLRYDVEIVRDRYGEPYCAVVHVDDRDGVWQEKLKNAKHLFYSLAGYCAYDDYDKWFIEL